MKEIQLKSQRFRAEREADWRRLETLLGRVERKSAASLSADELLSIPVLYRAALSSLSVARATSLDNSLIDYLESLSTRGYFFVYGARSRLFERIGQFFTQTWPTAVKALWRETLVSLAITVLSTVVGYLLVAHDPDWYYSFVGQGLASGRDPTASAKMLHDTLYYHGNNEGLSVTATYVFNNNASVTILAFALGFAFCIPTALLIAQNGLMLGAFLALYASRGLTFELVGWLAIHGVTEFFAIILGGAAGFKIGWAVAFPGERSRLQAAALAGRSAGAVMGGVVLMLVFAGLLEGFARQLINVDWQRYAIAGTTLVLWLTYFYLPRPGRKAP